eukprot:11216578-Lingulodinium_polyedra.AAC.1
MRMPSGARPTHSPASSTKSKRTRARQNNSSGRAAKSAAYPPSKLGVLRRPIRRKSPRTRAGDNCALAGKRGN